MKNYEVVETYYDWDADMLVAMTVAQNLTEEEAEAKAEEIRKVQNPEMGEEVNVREMDPEGC